VSACRRAGDARAASTSANRTLIVCKRCVRGCLAARGRGVAIGDAHDDAGRRAETAGMRERYARRAPHSPLQPATVPHLRAIHHGEGQ
jgi:hypothetical protein